MVTATTDLNENEREKQFVKAAQGSNNELISVDEKIEEIVDAFIKGDIMTYEQAQGLDEKYSYPLKEVMT